MSVMFANARATQGNSGYLVEFKAGRSQLQPGSSPSKRKVVAEKTKGTVFIKQSGDQLMHFCWKNRETGAVPDDLIIFSGDTEFVRVKECTDGRVYMLKFKNTDEKRLFWMQEGETDKDDEYCKKVNEILNNPPTVRQSARNNVDRNMGSVFGGALAAIGNSGTEGDVPPLGNLDQNQLMQLLSLMNNTNSNSDAANILPQIPLIGDGTQQTTETGNASAQVATPSNTPANGAVSGSGVQPNAAQLLQLKDIIARIAPNTRIELSDVLISDNVTESIRNNEDRLLPHVPDQEPIYSNHQELEQTVRTPQFRQAVDIFGHAFQTGQLEPVLRQFGMPPEVTSAAQTGDLINFAKKLTEAERPDEKSSTSTSSSQPAPSNPQIDAEIAKEAENEENNESAVKEPEPKRGKPDDDNMDLD